MLILAFRFYELQAAVALCALPSWFWYTAFFCYSSTITTPFTSLFVATIPLYFTLASPPLPPSLFPLSHRTFHFPSPLSPLLYMPIITCPHTAALYPAIQTLLLATTPMTSCYAYITTSSCKSCSSVFCSPRLPLTTTTFSIFCTTTYFFHRNFRSSVYNRHF